MNGTVKTMVIIRAQGLSKTFGTGENTVHALRSVDANFEHGTFTAIMGPSGSGKSTFLQCLAGLDTPTSGAITIGETNLTDLSETELTRLRRDRLGFVFQSFNLVQSLTAAQNVALPLLLNHKPPKDQTVHDVLARVGLADKAARLPSQLSGGQQQRVAIARALIVQPDILFADEPTGALDIKASKDFLQLIRSIVVEQGQTVVMVTHDPIAAASADRVLFLADGQIAGELSKPSTAAIIHYMTQLEQ